VTTFFTIGHSTRSVEEFVELLRRSGVESVADVRSIPRSRRNPQFNLDQLPAALALRQIGYAHLPALGGRRSRQMPSALSPNSYWRVTSFRNYADYAMGPTFADGLARLRALGATRPTAIMCAEAVWWRCHRRIVADYLLAAGEAVFHILGPSPVRAAQPTPGAVTRPDGRLVYPLSTNAANPPGAECGDGLKAVDASRDRSDSRRDCCSGA
jgi:uncharacterized protein (DUF488 family)